MATFEEAVHKLLGIEQGTVDHPADRGGLTNWGISARRYPDEDIATLSQSRAIELYRRDFWNPLYEKLDQPLANKILDLTVNLPHGDARPYYQTDMLGIRLVQQAIAAAGNKVIDLDGRFGPQTLQALRLGNGPKILRAIRQQQSDYYIDLVREKPSQLVFLKGWMRRVLATWAAATMLSLAGGPVLAQHDTLERMEEDFLKLSEPCDALPSEERRIGGEEFRVRRYRCGTRIWRLWQSRCPEGSWSRTFLIDQADDHADSYYLDRFAGLHNGRPRFLVEVYRPSCAA